MTDIQMPVMTGIELSQKLKNEDIIVVFFSAYQDFEYARAAIINHVTDYLIKPMKYDAMSACFERIRKTWTNVRRAIICLTKSMQTRQIMWRL